MSGDAQSDQEKPSIIVDEDWKSKVQREKTEEANPATDEKSAVEEKPDAEMDFSQLPPADFSMLISMFSTQAMVALGMIPEPSTGKPRTQLPLARHFIDLLSVLEEKTKGNLADRESSGLTENLHYLRMLYLETTKQK
ncbi:MAG: DUF1844 domain-containing protein [Planctomycetaceae bacterium]|nr:DUF1844 domain-containing protein [Planctomycetaceae bacterium]